jgi:hypothetical protein
MLVWVGGIKTDTVEHNMRGAECSAVSTRVINRYMALVVPTFKSRELKTVF